MVEERLEKEKQRLKKLKEQREELDRKIKDKEAVIQDLTDISKQEKFDAVQEVLHVSGFTLEEVMQLVRSGEINKLKDGKDENNADD